MSGANRGITEDEAEQITGIAVAIQRALRSVGEFPQLTRNHAGEELYNAAEIWKRKREADEAGNTSHTSGGRVTRHIDRTDNK